MFIFIIAYLYKYVLTTYRKIKLYRIYDIIPVFVFCTISTIFFEL